jgi:Secretion system C-terminal sorting domain
VSDKRTIPMVNIAAPKVLTCKNLTSILTADSIAGYAYLWNNGAISNVINVDSAGTYQLSVTEISNGCENTFNAIVLENKTKPTVTFSPIEKITCAKKEVAITASNVNNYTYLWSNGTALNTIKTSKSGIYTLSVTNNDNDCKAIFTTSAVEKDTIAPNLQLSVSNDIYCKKTSADIKGNLENGVTYLWSNGNINSTLTTTNAGTYSATVTASANGCTTQKIAVVNEIKNPTLELTSVVNASNGTKNDGEIHVTGKLGKSPYTYTWLANGKSITGGADLTNLAGGVYNVTLTDVNTCTISIEKIVLKGAVQVTDLEEVSAFNAYPNPILDKLNVTISLKENQNVTLSIIDISGRVIAKKNIFSSQNISEVFETQDLQKGVYFLQVQINGKIKAVELMKL